MSELDVHAPVPPGAEAALRTVIAATREGVEEAVAGVHLPSPAYALCLWVGDDDADLTPMSVSVGIDADRRRHLAAGRPELAWSHADYAIDELDVRDGAGRPGFSAAAGELVARLREAGIAIPALWVLREAARELTNEPPPLETTDDFVAFAVASFTTARDGVEHSLTPTLRARLAGRGLLPESPPVEEDEAR